MSLITNIYRKYMPINLRYKIGKLRVSKTEKDLFQKVRRGDWIDSYKAESEYMMRKGKVLTFPYVWTEAYDEKDIAVYIDAERKMPYVMVEGKRLYFPKRYPAPYIRTYFNTLLIEQDPRSPHFYFDPSDPMLKHTVFLDIGGAEGYIALRVIPFVDKVVIFECDQDWIEALQTTFEPWKDRVQIIDKYAGDRNADNMVKIDDVVQDCKNVVLKLDVEGMEATVLSGATRTLHKPDTKVFVCTYHRKGDEKELGELLKKNGYYIQKSDNYMFYGGKDAGFRKGLIRAWKE